MRYYLPSMSVLFVIMLGATIVAASAATVTTGCTNETFPFTYFDNNGNVVPGTAGSDGICTFPEANCGPETHVYECCKKNMDASGYKMEGGSNWMLFGLIPVFVQISWRKRYGTKPGDLKKMVPGWVEGLPPRFQKLFKLGFAFLILPGILIPIYMNNSIQSSLTASNRNALLGAQAFLDPYRDVFQFVEDIVLVRVSYSLAIGNKKETNMLVHFGLMAGLFVGLVAAIIGTILGVIPASLGTLTNPGASRDAEVYGACDLFDYSSDLVQPYWLLQMWGIPGLLLGMVLSGFMFGAHELLTVAWLSGIGMCMVPAIWFGAKPQQHKHDVISLLGIADIVSDWTFPVLCLAYLISSLGKDIREHTGFTFSLKTCKSILCKHFSGSSEEDEDPRGSLPERERLLNNNALAANEQEQDLPSNKDLIIDGLKIMSLDLATQIGITIGVYLALVSDASVGYQITALMAALPSVGVAYSFSLGFFFKMLGPKFIVDREYDLFAKFTYVTIGCGVLLFPIIIGVTETFKVGQAFNYGENACEYAKDDQCVGFFSGVFGENGTMGKFTLPFTWNAMSYGACVDVMSIITRSILLACKDFDYMLKGVAVSIILYIPAIIVVTVGGADFVGEAISLFAVMYLPQFITSLLFLVRIFIVLKKMKNGESGPWESEPVNTSIHRSFRHDSKK